MNKVRDGIIGVVIGDMLGVPVEFFRREALNADPVVGVREFGSHKHSSALRFLIFDMGEEGIDVYLHNITPKEEDWWLGAVHSGSDLLMLVKNSKRYIDDIEHETLLTLVRLS